MYIKFVYDYDYIVIFEKFYDSFSESALWKPIAYFWLFASCKADYQRELNSSISDVVFVTVIHESSTRRGAREASVGWCFSKKSSGEI